MASLTTLAFTNTAGSGKESVIAQDVTATVEVFDGSRVRIKHSHGRWHAHEWMDPTPMDSVLHADPPIPVTMKPDGAQHRLDVLAGMTFLGDRPNEWVGTYLVAQPKHATFMSGALPPGEHELRITLRSANMRPAVFKYRLVVQSSEGRETHHLKPELARV